MGRGDVGQYLGRVLCHGGFCAVVGVERYVFVGVYFFDFI